MNFTIPDLKLLKNADQYRIPQTREVSLALQSA